MDCSGRSCRAVFLLNSHSTSQVADLSDSDVVATIAHELGHAIGLGHSEYKHNLMYFSAGGKTQKWLGEDDIDGVNYLYPEEANLGGLFGSCATIKTDNDSDSSGSGFIFSLALGIFLAFAIGIASKGRNYFA